jgi:predicted nucleic acid-binding protein
MNLIVDTNVLFTYFWPYSIIHDILTLPVHLISPEYSLEEIQNHSEEIIRKTAVTKQEFHQKLEKLAYHIDFIPLSSYAPHIKKAAKLFESTYKMTTTEFLKDIDFYALALKKGYPIWTNDALFKKQQEIQILNTKEIILLCRKVKN